MSISVGYNEEEEQLEVTISLADARDMALEVASMAVLKNMITASLQMNGVSEDWHVKARRMVQECHHGDDNWIYERCPYCE